MTGAHETHVLCIDTYGIAVEFPDARDEPIERMVAVLTAAAGALTKATRLLLEDPGEAPETARIAVQRALVGIETLMNLSELVQAEAVASKQGSTVRPE